MERASYLSTIRHETDTLLLAAASAGFDAAVPSCPDWTVERLVGHVGRVHRWTAGWVMHGAAPTVERPPNGDAVVAWTAAGTDDLLAALAGGDDDAPVSTWLGERPGRFWPVRMAVETALHRWDAESADGEADPLDAPLAVAGIDEMLDVMLPERAGDALTGDGETLHLHATDVDGEWLLTLGPDRPAVERTHAKGDVAARGSASDLLLFLWNRAPRTRLEVFGDEALLDRWTTSVRL